MRETNKDLLSQCFDGDARVCVCECVYVFPQPIDVFVLSLNGIFIPIRPLIG